MHQSFVATANPAYGEGCGISGLKCGANTLECPRSAGELTEFCHYDSYHREIFYYTELKDVDTESEVIGTQTKDGNETINEGNESKENGPKNE